MFVQVNSAEILRLSIRTVCGLADLTECLKSTPHKLSVVYNCNPDIDLVEQISFQVMEIGLMMLEEKLAEERERLGLWQLLDLPKEFRFGDLSRPLKPDTCE